MGGDWSKKNRIFIIFCIFHNCGCVKCRIFAPPLDEIRQRSIETLTTYDNKMVLADMVIIRGLGVEVTTKTPFSMLTSQSELKGLIGRKAETNI